MRSRLSQDRVRRFLRIHREHFGKQSGDIGYSHLTRGPGTDHFWNGLQPEPVRDTVREFTRCLQIHGPQCRTDGLPADPESAAFIPEIWSPAAHTKHVPILVAADD